MIDQQAKALAQAIRRAETGSVADPYNAKGASGEFGAYQFMPDTYRNYAKKYLGDENAPPTVENQNKIAYSFVKEKKDAGFVPAQIASMWNAGEGRPNAYKEGFRGTNKLGVAYDVPAYAQKVSQNYRELAAQIVPTAQASTIVQTQQKKPSLPFGPAGIGKALGTAIGAGARSEKLNEDIQKILDGQRELLSRRNKAANEGRDTSRFDIALAQTNKTLQELGGSAQDISTGNITSGNVAGAALETIGLLPIGAGASAIPKAIGSKAGTLSKVATGVMQGAKAGAISGGIGGAGTALRRDENPITGAIGGAVAGGVLGGVIGGAVPAVAGAARGIKQGVSDVADPSAIMQRVARVSKAKQINFEKTAKESIGDYLVKRGIYGDSDQIVEQLAKRFTDSKAVADAQLSAIKGTYKPRIVQTTIKELIKRETAVSSPGALSKDLKRVLELQNKFKKNGLNMSEINEVKRLFERNVKLEFIKERAAEKVAKATNIDNALRAWQFGEAEKQGFKNLAEVNRETRLARQLMDNLGAEQAGLQGNNAISLSDWVVLSNGDPTAAAAFLTKKTFSNKKLQSWVARLLAGQPTVGQPQAITGAPRPDLTDFLTREP